MTDQYAVFGNPIAHSLSPRIHSLFAEQTGQQLDYRAHRVEAGEFAREADAFFASEGRGLNITLPYKGEAYSYAARLTPRARKAGAVNTLAKQADGIVLGDNTDGIGLVTDITENLGWPIRAKKLLILGAGGAVRGVLKPVLEELPQHVVIANRTVDKALQLARGFAEDGYLLGCGFDMLEGQQFDLVINGTSASLQGDMPPLPEQLLESGGKCYDMMYGANPTPFMIWASQHGATGVADGLGMLVEQAAESFRLWRGVSPETGVVIDTIRLELTC